MFALIAKLITIIAFANLLFLIDSVDSYDRGDGWQCYDYNGQTPYKCVKAYCPGFIQPNTFIGNNFTEAQAICEAEGGSLLEIYSDNDTQIAFEALRYNTTICEHVGSYWVNGVGDNDSLCYNWQNTGCSLNATDRVISWYSGFPNAMGQCAVFFTSGGIRGNKANWANGPCSFETYHLCQQLNSTTAECISSPDTDVCDKPPPTLPPTPPPTPPPTTTPTPTTKKCRKYRN